MKTTEKDALHIVAIVRALHDAQRFLGGLSAEEFAENDEKQNAVAMVIARAGEHTRKLSKEFRESEIRRSMAWGEWHARLDRP